MARPLLRDVAPRAGYLREARAADLREFVTGRGEGSFFCTHLGPSMAPLLVEGDLLEVLPGGGTGLVPGDVILCVPAGAPIAVVHRVLEVTPQGIRTRGDNNRFDDDWLLAPADVLGRIVAAWREASRRPIAGGRAGQRQAARARWAWAADRHLSSVLRVPYDALARSGVLRRLLPARLRPRVVVFDGAPAHWRLMRGGRAIGHYDPAAGRWRIKRPFRLIVDEASLPRPSDPIGPAA